MKKNYGHKQMFRNTDYYRQMKYLGRKSTFEPILISNN